MKTFDWKEKYTRYDGIDVTADAKYYSLLGTKAGTGSRNNPIYRKQIGGILNNSSLIFSSGIFDMVLSGDYNSRYHVIGQGFDNTYFKQLTIGGNAGVCCVYRCKIKYQITSNVPPMLIECYIEDSLKSQFNIYSYNCILKNCQFFHSTTQTQCTFTESNVSVILPNTSLFSECNIILNKDTIAGNQRNNYLAFNKCKFQIGNEAIPTLLIGNSANQLRQNFADRCLAQGITPPEIAEFGERNKMGRWIFSNTSITGEYNTIENSEIDRFAKQRGLYFGHTDKTVKVIPIVSADNVPQSFAPANPRSKTVVSDNSITLDKATSIIDLNLGYTDSKIIWLGGKYELTALNVINNLPADVGVAVDSLFSFGDPIKNNEVEAEINYIVRSSDKQPATIKYNNVEYDTSLLTRNNVFRGITNIKTFEVVSGKPQILPVLDFANHQTVQMRIVTDLPTEKITTGNLQAGYWYYVAPNDLSDTSGSVTYKGIKRPCFDSFLADTNTSFAINGTCHLRRCWKQEYDEDTEPTDKAFWNGKQKPKWFDILPADLRCFHKNNSSSELEMQRDAKGNYIASGHVDFYNGVSGAAGFKAPTFGIVGSFMQIRIPISTLNPM